MPDPPKEPAPSEDEEPKGLLRSYTNTHAYTHIPNG